MYARRARGGALCCTFRIFIIVSILIGVVLVTPAPANSPDVLSLVDQMKVAFEPARPRVRRRMITVSSDEGYEHATWIAGVARKHLPDGKRSLIVLLEPESARGNALLLWERGDQQDTMWLYTRRSNVCVGSSPLTRMIASSVPTSPIQTLGL